MVLVGLRPSIATYLRRLLLSDEKPRTLKQLQDEMPSLPTPPCFLFFCDGHDMIHLEKDYRTALVTSTSGLGEQGSFLVGTNHDRHMESWESEKWKSWARDHTFGRNQASMRELVTESIDRRCQMQQRWTTYNQWKTSKEDSNGENSNGTAIDPRQEAGDNVQTRPVRRSSRLIDRAHQKDNQLLDLDTLIKWVKTAPTLNEMTHFACILDPILGSIVWREWYKRPQP
jgi:hypothetical protein